MVSFTFFTLAITYLVRIFHLDPNIIRLFAVLVLVFLGLSMIIPALSRLTELWVSRLSGRFGRTGKNLDNDFSSGFLTGLSLGIVWTPCSGPILASIATLAATGQVSYQVILVTLAYVTGVGIPLFIFAYGGQRVIGKTRFLSGYTGRVQQGFGVLMLLTALAIYTNYDKVLQLKLLEAFPSYSSVLTSFEKNSAVKDQLDVLKGRKLSTDTDSGGLFNANKSMPEFAGITKWLNSEPLTAKGLKGKVVLIDFWTYTCINCIRSLPHVTGWYEKYKDQGFVVIGVHTPEFEFEKDTKNVQNAVKQYKINYPVAQDNDFATWNNYSNQYWPAEYLIDAKGVIRRTHFGEGKYEETEMAIQALLKEAGNKVDSKIESMPDQTPTGKISPETYVGSARMKYYYPSGSLSNGKQTLNLSDNPDQNSFSLGGEWDIQNENSIAGKNATLNYNFTADKVYLVMRPGSSRNAKVKVYIDGKLVDSKKGGADVKNGITNIDSDRLYNLIDNHGKVENHLLKLEFTPGIAPFAFTFG